VPSKIIKKNKRKNDSKVLVLEEKNVETIIAISKLEIFSAVVRLGCYFFSHGSSKSLSFTKQQNIISAQLVCQ